MRTEERWLTMANDKVERGVDFSRGLKQRQAKDFN